MAAMVDPAQVAHDLACFAANGDDNGLKALAGTAAADADAYHVIRELAKLAATHSQNVRGLLRAVQERDEELAGRRGARAHG